MTDWQKVFKTLANAGYTDSQIGKLCNKTRAVVCNVRNGTYPFVFEPGHAGGEVVLAELRKVEADLPKDNPMD